jgi:hypothetical protein
MWLEHARNYSEKVSSRFNLGAQSLVIEVASNDGYLLRNFIAAGIPCLGVEPTSDTADAAISQGIPVLKEFFGEELGRRLASEGRQADLIAANNVYAHVPDINDFTAGLKAALKAGGAITLEFPHLMRLIEHVQFDTIYHEHFSYLSLYTVDRILRAHGLRVFDVEELPTHGGSIRVYACHLDDLRADTARVSQMLSEEESRGLQDLSAYKGFQAKVDSIKNELLAFLVSQKLDGRRVAAYGAAAKGNTILNYAGVRPDLVMFVCDAAPSKQGKFMPGSHIPIVPPSHLKLERPDLVLILPWNIADEVTSDHSYVGQWGGKFLVAVPSIRFIEASV